MRYRVGTILSITGAIIAFMIGSAFGSGQELMQFFTAYGVKGCIGSLTIMAGIFVWVCAVMMDDGYLLQFESASDIWLHYCGRIGGRLIQSVSMVFLYSLLVLMISGSGASLNEFSGWPHVVGRAGMTVAVTVTLLLGRKQLTKVLAATGVMLTVLVVAVSVISMAQNTNGLETADAILATKTVTKASNHWWLSGLLHPAYSLVCLAPFLAGLSYGVTDRKAARLGGMLGGISVAVIAATLSLALLMSIADTATADIPTLAIVRNISPAFSYVYIVILMLGIFSTAVSLQWLICNAVIKGDEKSPRYRLFAIAATLVAYVASVLPFKSMINVVLPYMGYIGIAVLICMVYVRYVKPRLKHRDTASASCAGPLQARDH